MRSAHHPLSYIPCYNNAMPIPLQSPSRPTLNHRPTYLNGHTVIAPLGIWPLASGMVEVSAFLPMQGEGISVAGRFERVVHPHELGDLITQFGADPEGFLEDFFAGEKRPPALRLREKAQAPKLLSLSLLSQLLDVEA